MQSECKSIRIAVSIEARDSLRLTEYSYWRGERYPNQGAWGDSCSLKGSTLLLTTHHHSPVQPPPPLKTTTRHPPPPLTTTRWARYAVQVTSRANVKFWDLKTWLALLIAQVFTVSERSKFHRTTIHQMCVRDTESAKPYTLDRNFLNLRYLFLER